MVVSHDCSPLARALAGNLGFDGGYSWEMRGQAIPEAGKRQRLNARGSVSFFRRRKAFASMNSVAWRSRRLPSAVEAGCTDIGRSLR